MKLPAALSDRDVAVAGAALRVWQGCPGAGAWLTAADWERAERILEGAGEPGRRAPRKRRWRQEKELTNTMGRVSFSESAATRSKTMMAITMQTLPQLVIFCDGGSPVDVAIRELCARALAGEEHLLPEIEAMVDAADQADAAAVAG